MSTVGNVRHRALPGSESEKNWPIGAGLATRRYESIRLFLFDAACASLMTHTQLLHFTKAEIRITMSVGHSAFPSPERECQQRKGL
jgi:hypothetical protein